MKKSALILLTLFYSSTLLLSSVRPVSADTATDLTCKAVGGVFKISGHNLDFPSQEACEGFLATLKELFKNQPDGPWYNQHPTQFAKKITSAPPDEIFGERYTFAQINWIINSIATMLNPASGIDSPDKLFEFLDHIKSTLESLKTGQVPTLQQYARLGPAGLFAGGISALYSNPPASGIGEIKYMATRLLDIGTGVQPAYAQTGGYGFSGLGGNSGSAVRALWTASRNMAYLIMIILLIASGFLIMFRVKINPQTVVSLQTMIPKLIITLLLVTFSFAIAGLVIDLIYVFIAAIVGFLSLGGVIDPNFVPSAIGNLTAPSFFNYLVMQTTFFIIAALAALIAGIVIGLVFVWAPPLAAIIGIITTIVVFVWIIFIFFKIFIMLLKAYITLILQIVIAPLQIMLDLIPGQQGFGGWIRNLIANASVFVVVPVMVIIQHIFSWNPITNSVLGLKSFGETNLQLPFIGSAPLSGGDLWGSLVLLVASIYVLSLTPKVADIVRDALKIPAFKYGAAFGEALAPFRTMTAQSARELTMQAAQKGGLVTPIPGKGWQPSGAPGGEAVIKLVDMATGFLGGKGS